MTSDGLVNSPQLSEQGKRAVRSVKDADQARRVVRAMIEQNRARMVVNGRITAKYNAERPYRQGELEAEGLGWRSNFTTKPLPQMIEKVAPRFVEAVQGLKYLTNSSLPDEIEGAHHKTDVFRKAITDAIRGRKGWRVFLEDLAQENALYGFTCVAWLDEFTWFPKHFRQDEFFIPRGTKQLVNTAQLAVLKETYLPHELFRYIEDREAAETVGWKIDATIKAVNAAAPPSVRAVNNADPSRVYEDLFRELSAGHSFEQGASVVEVYSLLVTEIDGQVSHYRLAGDGLDEIFVREDRFESMDDALAFFSFQKGNGTMHGSKGIGREIYELAGIIDRCRNEVVDRLVLSGKVFIQGDARSLKKFKMSVVGNAILIESGVSILEQRVDGNVEGFLKLDSYMGLLVDQLIGSVSPPKLEGEAFRSPEAWKLFASREEEGKDAKIARFLEQFAETIGTMQRRLCDPDTIDEDAKAMQKKLLEIMTREQLDKLAKQPVAGSVVDLTPQQRQQIAMLATESRGNLLYNQRALEKEKLTAVMNAEFADTVLLPDNDPTEQAEQLRAQQMELLLLSSGQPVPVSPRDNHKLHLSVVMPLLEKIAASIHEGQTGTAVLDVMAAHANEHVQMALSHGAKASEFSQESSLLKKLAPVIEQLHQLDTHAETLADASESVAAPPAQSPEMQPTA